MPIAYSYVRFSTAKQEHGDSLRRQTELSDKYAKSHGLTLDTTLKLEDLGVSAFNRSNVESGAFRAFLEAIEQKRVERGSFLLVESLDRLSRAEVLDALNVFTKIVNAGISIVTLADGQCYSRESLSTNGSQLMLSIGIMMRAHEESETKSRRGAAAWSAKRERATEQKLTSRCPSWMKISDDRKRFILIPSAVKLVRRILQLTKDGYGETGVAKKLNLEGVPNISGRGKGWHSSYVQKILGSSALYGDAHFEVHKKGKRLPIGEPLANYYPAIITREEWASIQLIRRSRHTGGGGASRKGNVTNLFAGLLRCGYCRASMTLGGYSRKDPIKAKKYVVCATARRGMGCTYVQWAMPHLERLLLSYIREIDLAALLHQIAENRPLETLHAQRETLQREKSEIKRRLAKVVEAVETGGNASTLVARIVELEAIQAEMEARAVSLDQQIAIEESTSTTVTATYNSLSEVMDSLVSATKTRESVIRQRLAEHIRQLIGAVYLYPGGIDAKYYYDEAGKPTHADLLTIDKSTRLALLWFRAGDIVRQVVEANGEAHESDYAVPAGIGPMNRTHQ